MRSVFEKFDTERSVWAAAVSCSAVLDALLALALVSSTPGYVWPQIAAARGEGSAAAKPFIHIIKGRHPMLEHSLVERCGWHDAYSCVLLFPFGMFQLCLISVFYTEERETISLMTSPSAALARQLVRIHLLSQRAFN